MDSIDAFEMNGQERRLPGLGDLYTNYGFNPYATDTSLKTTTPTYNRTVGVQSGIPPTPATQVAADANTSAKKNWWETLSTTLTTGADIASKYRSSGPPAGVIPPPAKAGSAWKYVGVGAAALLALGLLTRKQE